MKPGRALGIAVLSRVDALVPTVVAAFLVFSSTSYWLYDAVNPVVLAAGAGVLAFVGTLTVGVAATLLGYGPFPATKAAKFVWRASFWEFGRRRKR
jgi:zinc transporter ZupT